VKFNGTTDDLEKTIIGIGREIHTKNQKTGMFQFKTIDGISINLYTNGTLQIQGKDELKDQFENDFNQFNGDSGIKVEIQNPSTNLGTQNLSKQVFLVHGHDETAREQLELILHKLGLQPFVLMNSGGGGLTIIESLEKKIGQNSNDTSFGIVLMTPDDMGYAVKDGGEQIKARPRQNVVLEMGMLISSIGRKNMAILVKGTLEKPSDADGILYLSFNHHVKETVPRLSQRLKDSGFILNPDQIAHASS
jgi:predicted nucleotide-binding protein